MFVIRSNIVTIAFTSIGQFRLSWKEIEPKVANQTSLQITNLPKSTIIEGIYLLR